MCHPIAVAPQQDQHLTEVGPEFAPFEFKNGSKPYGRGPRSELTGKKNGHVMLGTLTTSEEAQLTQTIEMFEVITQSQPQDYQSLEILKEAYVKLGRDQDAVNTSKRIAQAYVLMGQLSSAILEYESILQRFPDDPDVLAALGEIENKANSLNAQPDLGDTTPPTRSQAKTAKSKESDTKTSLATIDDG